MLTYSVLSPAICVMRDSPDGPHGDLILRSSDHVDFQVSKRSLADASALFFDMFSLPSTSFSSSSQECDSADTPVVAVTERSDFLAVFLGTITVDRPPMTFKTLSQIEDLYRIADKYLCDSAMEIARTALASRAHTSPLQVYLTACRLDLQSEAKTAARRTLRYSISELRETASRSGDEVAVLAPALERLYAYHEECKVAVRAVTDCEYWAINDLKFFPNVFFDPRIPPTPSVFSTQPRCCTTLQTSTEIGTYYVKSWFLPFLGKLADVLAMKPSGEELGFEEWSGLFRDAVSQAKQCSRCGQYAFDLLRMYSKNSLGRADTLINAVGLEFRAL